MVDTVRAHFRDTPEPLTASLLRAIADHESAQRQLLARLRHAPGVDQTWVNIAETELLSGIEGLLRALSRRSAD